jgi:hypothetical protein
LKARVVSDRVERRIAPQVELEMETSTWLEARQPFHRVVDVAERGVNVRDKDSGVQRGW